MDINKIFNKFNKEKENKDFFIPSIEDTPIYWLGMFKKIILYSNEFNKKLIRFIKEIGLEEKIENPEKGTKHLTFLRAFYYLNQVNPADPIHREYIKSQGDKNLKNALLKTKLHFEKIEEYEKCAHISKIEKILKDNLEEQ